MVHCALRQMRLMGFRSMYFQDVDFDNPTFVVGPNGSGKSNFTDAFAFPLGGHGLSLASGHRTAWRVFHRFPSEFGGGRPSNLTLRVKLEKLDSDTTEASYYIDPRLPPFCGVIKCLQRQLPNRDLAFLMTGA